MTIITIELLKEDANKLLKLVQDQTSLDKYWGELAQHILSNILSDEEIENTLERLKQSVD